MRLGSRPSSTVCWRKRDCVLRGSSCELLAAASRQGALFWADSRQPAERGWHHAEIRVGAGGAALLKAWQQVAAAVGWCGARKMGLQGGSVTDADALGQYGWKRIVWRHVRPGGEMLTYVSLYRVTRYIWG